MAGMVSFSPEDVIFLLNKWDTIFHEEDDQLKNYFEETKKCLRKVWDDVDESRIFKISAKQVSTVYIIISKRNICVVLTFLGLNQYGRHDLHNKSIREYILYIYVEFSVIKPSAS